eukprot:scaffold106268_cov31-Tisochrysis_lutea.AAC.3
MAPEPKVKWTTGVLNGSRAPKSVLARVLSRRLPTSSAALGAVRSRSPRVLLPSIIAPPSSRAPCTLFFPWPTPSQCREESDGGALPALLRPRRRSPWARLTQLAWEESRSSCTPPMHTTATSTSRSGKEGESRGARDAIGSSLSLGWGTGYGLGVNVNVNEGILHRKEVFTVYRSPQLAESKE